MRLSTKAMAIAGGLLWGGALLLVGLLHMARPGYGTEFLRMTGSVYPWFHGASSAGDVLVGAVDGLVDGTIAGFVFGWLYNSFAGQRGA